MIVMYAQSLDWDSPNHYWYENAYYENVNQIPQIKTFFSRCSYALNSPHVQIDETTQIKYVLRNGVYYFSVYSNEKEKNTGRLSPVIFSCSIKEKDKLIDNLKRFTKKSNRSFSKDKWKFLYEFLKQETSTNGNIFLPQLRVWLQWHKKYLFIVGVGVVWLLLTLYILHR